MFVIWIVGFGCPLHRVYDTLYNVDLSGDNQVVTVGRKFKPVRVKSNPGCSVTFTYSGDTVDVREVVVGHESTAVYAPPVPRKPALVKIVAATDDTLLIFRGRVLRDNYWIVKVLELLGGFVLFMFGLNRGSTGIMRAVGGWTRALLTRLSRSPILAAFGGLIAALGFQSSTAVTVMVVSLTDLGFLTPASAMAMNAGAGVGTTFTVGILSLGFTYIAILMMALGYYLERFTQVYEHYGRALFGFGLAFFGIWQMGNVFSDMATIPYVVSFVHDISNNVLLMLLISAVFAALVHSSALTIGIALSMAFAGIITFTGALAVVLGANIGTAFTAVLASAQLSPVARRVALINLLGRTVLSLVLLPTIPYATHLPVWVQDLSKNIALSHFYYNLLFAAIVVPLTYVEPLWRIQSPIRERVSRAIVYDDPEFLLVYMEKVISDALNVVMRMFQDLYEAIRTRSPALFERIAGMDDEIDRSEEIINAYVSRAMAHGLTGEMGKKVVALAQIMEEIENIGDIISKSIVRNVEKLYKEGIILTDEELNGIKKMHSEVMKTLASAMVVLTTWDVDKARELLSRAKEVKDLLDRMRKEFYTRINVDNVQSGEVYLDILSDMERVNANAAAIGGAILESLSDESKTTG